MIKELTKVLVVAGSALFLSGCSSMFEIGEPPTECPKAVNGGLSCTSAREIWKMTDNKTELNAARDRSAGKTTKKHKKEKLKYPGGTAEERQAMYQEGGSLRDQLAAPEPTAVRQRAKILRVLVNSWEDDKGRLHMPGYTYVEVEKRHWVVGRGAIKHPAHITPLSIRKASLTDERRNNPVADNGMGIIQPKQLPRHAR